MRRFLLFGAIILTLATPVEALTIRDIIELSRAGISEDVLLALIEVERGVYPVDSATMKQLKAAGVSERVMVALVRSGREAPAVEPLRVEEPLPQAEPPAPQVVVIDHGDHERVREVVVPVAVPVYIPVAPRHKHGTRRVDGTYDASTFVPFQSGPPAARPVNHPPREPVYWGWGGKRRPDSWDPSPHPVTPPDRKH